MCIGVYTLEHPEYALIIATNRDEFLHRPTEDAHWHAFEHADAGGPSHGADITSAGNASVNGPTVENGHSVPAPLHVSSAIAKTASTIGRTILPAQVPPSELHATSASTTTTTTTTASISNSNNSNSKSEEEVGPILSGRDLQAGGTWLGVSRAGGRVALLTNITEPLAKWKISRGELVAGFLTMGSESNDRLHHGHRHDVLKEWEDKMGVNRGGGAGEYAGFNLLLLAPRLQESKVKVKGEEEEREAQGKRRISYDARFVTNHGGGGPLESRPLSEAERRCGGISNGVDHSCVRPVLKKDNSGSEDGREREGEMEVEVEVTNDAADEWPKVRHARGDFSELLQEDETKRLQQDELVERLFGVLEWHPEPHPVAHRGELRNTVHVLPVRIGLPAVVGKGTKAESKENRPAHPPLDMKAAQTEGAVPTPAPASSAVSVAVPSSQSQPQLQGQIQAGAGIPSDSGSAQLSSAGSRPTPNSSAKVQEPTEIQRETETTKVETPPAFYGTRLATIVLVPRDPEREALFIERDIWALGVGVDVGVGANDGVPVGVGPDAPGGGVAPDSEGTLRDGGAEERPVRVDKSRQRVFRFRMDFGDGAEDGDGDVAS